MTASEARKLWDNKLWGKRGKIKKIAIFGLPTLFADAHVVGVLFCSSPRRTGGAVDWGVLMKNYFYQKTTLDTQLSKKYWTRDIAQGCYYYR